jgi:putative hydrolase of the HAD superfamily
VKLSGVLEAGIEAIVFDAVGTLIEPEPAVGDVYREAARRQGVELERSVVKERFHRQFRTDEIDEAQGPLATDEPTEFARWRQIVGSVLREVPDPDRAFQELWDHFGGATAWRCYADVRPSLTAIAALGIPVAIASNFDARLRKVVRGLEELSDLIGAVTISSEVGYRKPHPEFYAAVCAALGLPPGRILFVGDDPENDVRGPERAGLRGLLLDRHGNRPGELPHLPDLHALVELIGRKSAG